MFKRMMDVDAEDLREMLFELFELLGNGGNSNILNSRQEFGNNGSPVEKSTRL